MQSTYMLDPIIGKPMPVKDYDVYKNQPWFIKLIRSIIPIFYKLLPQLTILAVFKMASIPFRRAKHKNAKSVASQLRKNGEWNIENKKIKYYKWGKSDKSILMVHGWESRGTAMRNLVPPLLEAGYQVVAIDLPAHGDSSAKGTNILEAGKVVAEVFNKVNNLEAIICHSFGCAVTTLACSLTKIRIPKVVYCGIPVSTYKIIDTARNFANLPPQSIHRFDDYIQKNYNYSLEDLNLSKLFRKTNIQEAFIVHDVKDMIVPFEDASAMAGEHNNIHLQITENLGHFRMLKNTEVVQRIASFIHQ